MAACAVSKYDKNISREFGGNLEGKHSDWAAAALVCDAKWSLNGNLWDRRTFAADRQGCGKPHSKPQRLSPSSARLTTCALSKESQVPLTLCPLTQADALFARICPSPSSCEPIIDPTNLINPSIPHRLSQWEFCSVWKASVNVLHQVLQKFCTIMQCSWYGKRAAGRLPLLTPSPNQFRRFNCYCE